VSKSAVFHAKPGGSFIVDTSASVERTLRIFCTNDTFAQKWTSDRSFPTFYDPTFKGHYLGHLVDPAARAA
jgi:hypothetical protein